MKGLFRSSGACYFHGTRLFPQNPPFPQRRKADHLFPQTRLKRKDAPYPLSKTQIPAKPFTESRKGRQNLRRGEARLFLFSALCALSPSVAFSEIPPFSKAVSDLLYEEDLTPDKTEKPFSLKAGLQYINGFIVSADRIGQFSVAGSYRFLKSWSVSVSQNLNQHYLRNPSSQDTGLWIQDTLLSLQRSFSGGENSVTAGVSSTLPLSHYSKVNDIYTLGAAYLIWSLKLHSFLKSRPAWLKDITFSLKPVARYYFSEYTTTPTKGQSAGGTPLPEFLFGVQTAGLTVSVTDRLSFSGSLGRWAVSVYNISPSSASRDPDYKKRLKHFYLLSFSTAFSFGKKWDMAFSYSHVDRVDKQGRVEATLFDNRLSSWTLSLSRSFSFDPPKQRPARKKAKRQNPEKDRP